MKKTLNINLSGISFIIDEDAYESLSRYLSTIRGYFSKSDGQDEIMSDIESRVAEMFSSFLQQQKKQIVNMDDVTKMMEVLGKPEQYIVDEETETADAHEKTTNTKEEIFTSSKGNKRIYRDKEGNVLGGVCSGIGYYFGFDPIWMRLAFAISFFVFGSGFLLYLLLWIIIPEAKSTAEKLEMKGEKVNIDNIRKVVEQEMKDVKNKFGEAADEVKDWKKKGHTDKLRNASNDAVGFLTSLFYLLFNAVKKVLGVFLLIIGTIGFMALISVIFGVGTSYFTFSPQPNVSFDMKEIFDLFLLETGFENILLPGLAMVIGIPLISFMLFGARLLFNIKKSMKWVGAVFSTIWFVGVCFLIYYGVNLAKEYSAISYETNKKSFAVSDSTALYLEASKAKLKGGAHGNINIGDEETDFHFLIDNGQVYMDNIKLDIVKSPNDSLYLQVDRVSRGNTIKEAKSRASMINYTYNIEANKMAFAPYFDFPTSEKFRGQEVKMTLYLPENRTVYLDKNMDVIIYDIENVGNTYDMDMLGHNWIMRKEGLTCIDCMEEN